MKSPLIVCLIALAVSAVALVVASTSGHGRVAVGSPPVAGSGGEVLARLQALADENRALRERVAQLEIQPPPAQRAPATASGVSREEFEAFQNELYDAVGGPDEFVRASARPPTPAELEEFRAHVADALDEIRKQEAADRIRAVQKRAESLDETLPEIERWLGLSADQSERMRSALLAKYDREADVVRRWEAGESPEVLGDLKRTDRETHVTELSEFLTAEQLEAYLSRSGGK